MPGTWSLGLAALILTLSPMVPYITFHFNVCLYFIPEDIQCHTCHYHIGCAAMNPTWKLQLGTQSVESPVWKRSTACAHGGGSMWRRETERERTIERSCHSSHQLEACWCLLPWNFHDLPYFMQLCLGFLILTRDVLMYRHPTRVQQITCKSKTRLAFHFLNKQCWTTRLTKKTMSFPRDEILGFSEEAEPNLSMVLPCKFQPHLLGAPIYVLGFKIWFPNNGILKSSGFLRDEELRKFCHF